MLRRQVLRPSLSRAARLWPHLFGTSGFFAARITRTGDTERAGEVSQPIPARPFERTGLVPVRRSQQAALSGQVLDGYGFDLPALLEKQALSLWRAAS